MRRFLLLLVAVAIALALWGNREDPPTAPQPFLCALEVGGETLLVQTVLAVDPRGTVRFTVGGVDDADPVSFSGEPRAAGALSDGLVVFFDDGATVLRWPPGPDGEVEWERIAYPDPEFRPMAATGLADGAVLVAGRVSSENDGLAWGRLADGVLTVEKSGATVNRAAFDPTLVALGDGAALVWFESWAQGSRVMTTPVPPKADEAPRVLLEAEAIGAVGAVPGPASPRVLVLEPKGRMTSIPLSTGDPESAVVSDVPEDGQVLLTATGGEAGRIFAFTGLRLLEWDVGSAGLPASSAARVLEAPPDLRWILLICGCASALIIILLIAMSRRRRDEIAAPTDAPTELAGIGRRVAAWALDACLVMPPLVLGMAWATGVELARLVTATSVFGATTDGRMTLLVVLTECVFLLYFVVSETVWGQTLGKRALEIRAVRLDGGRAGLAAVLVRNVLRMVIDVYGGAVLVFLTARRQRVGDLLARTMVIRTRTIRRTFESDPEKDHD